MFLRVDLMWFYHIHTKLTMWHDGCVIYLHFGNHSTIHMPIRNYVKKKEIMSYTLNIYNYICQLFLNRFGEENLVCIQNLLWVWYFKNIYFNLDLNVVDRSSSRLQAISPNPASVLLIRNNTDNERKGSHKQMRNYRIYKIFLLHWVCLWRRGKGYSRFSELGNQW